MKMKYKVVAFEISFKSQVIDMVQDMNHILFKLLSIINRSSVLHLRTH